MEVKDYKVDRDIYHLLKDEPFFALLSRQLDKRPTDTISTAGMRYNPDRLSYELIYNDARVISRISRSLSTPYTRGS